LDGNVEAIQALIKAGANVNAGDVEGETPLHLAAFDGNVEAIQALIKAGANVDAGDVEGETPLHLAARYGDVEAIQALIDCGADVNTLNNRGETPLRSLMREDFLLTGYSNKQRKLKAIQVLIDHGAYANGLSKNEWDELRWCSLSSFNQRLEFVIMLLGHNAANFKWKDAFPQEAITAFLTPPNAEAIAPIAEWVNRVLNNHVNAEMRQALAAGLQTFLQAIRQGLVLDKNDDEVVVVGRQEEALIEELIKRLCVGPTTKSARKVVE